MSRLLVATFLTTHFGEWRGLWHGGAARDDRRPGTSLMEEAPRHHEGALAIFDYDTGEMLWSLKLDTPAGFTFDDEHLYLNSMYGNRILAFDRRLRVVDSISLGLMNDIHSVVKDRGRFLVTSSGVDAVLEIGLDGDIEWSWFAGDRAYRQNPKGFLPRVDKRKDYRTVPIHTMDQITHCNSAVPAVVAGRRVVLVSLFHQGEVIAVDYETLNHSVLVTGIGSPHSIRRRRGGWLVSDSRSGGVVLLDDEFWVQHVVEADFDWVQDAVELEDGLLLIADANHSRLVEWDLARHRPRRQLEYPDEWKVYQVEVPDSAWQEYLTDVVVGGATLAEGG